MRPPAQDAVDGYGAVGTSHAGSTTNTSGCRCQLAGPTIPGSITVTVPADNAHKKIYTMGQGTLETLKQVVCMARVSRVLARCGDLAQLKCSTVPPTVSGTHPRPAPRVQCC